MKIVLLWLAALSFLAGGTGRMVPWQGAARAADKKPDSRPAAKPLEHPDIVGVTRAVSADGKTITVATVPPVKDAEEKTIEVKLTDKTCIVFTSVAAGQAQVVKGYFIRVWLARGSKDSASRIHLAGTSFPKGHAPSLAGVVISVSADGKSFTVLLAAQTKEDREEQATIKLTDTTDVRFTNVSAKGARLHKGMQAVVWLADEAKDIASRVRLYGSAEKYAKGGPSAAPAYAGRVAIAQGNKSITLEVPAQKKGDKPSRVTIPLGEKTRQVYRNVAEDGADPRAGYRALVWREEGARDGPAKKVLFIDPLEKKRVLLLGRVRDVADDGKSFTLLTPGQDGDEEGTRKITFADKAQVIFHNVGPDGARPTRGYSARVWLAEGSKEAAAMVVLEGKTR